MKVFKSDASFYIVKEQYTFLIEIVSYDLFENFEVCTVFKDKDPVYDRHSGNLRNVPKLKSEGLAEGLTEALAEVDEHDRDYEKVLYAFTLFERQVKDLKKLDLPEHKPTAFTAIDQERFTLVHNDLTLVFESVQYEVVRQLEVVTVYRENVQVYNKFGARASLPSTRRCCVPREIVMLEFAFELFKRKVDSIKIIEMYLSFPIDLFDPPVFAVQKDDKTYIAEMCVSVYDVCAVYRDNKLVFDTLSEDESFNFCLDELEPNDDVPEKVIRAFDRFFALEEKFRNFFS